jgi:LuxR family maltose regulon positive regulatory protein
LFRELLLRELRRRTPDRETALRCRAIEWHEMHHEWNAAVDQALASGGMIDAPAVLFKHVRATVSAAQVASVGRWLAAFEPSEVRSNALLALSASWHALFSGSYDEIDRWLQAAAACEHQGPLPDGTLDVPTAIAAVQMFAATGGVQTTAAAARTVIDAGPDGGPWRSVAMLLEAVALQLSGTVDDARSLFEVAEFETRGFPAGHAVVLAHLGIDALYEHDASRGNELVRAALDEVNAAGIGELGHIAMVFVGKALADARAGAFEASRQASDHAEHLASTLRTVHARGWIHQHLILADAAIARGDWSAASRLHREAQGRLHLQPDAVVLHEWAARIDRRCSAHQALGHRLELTPAEQRVLEQLATHRTLAEIGDHLYVSRNTVKTHAVSIYRKLQVSGRGEAVTRAIEWSLLHGTVEQRQRSAVNTR